MSAQRTGPTIRQRDDGLDESLAEGALAGDGRPLVVLQRPRQHLQPSAMVDALQAPGCLQLCVAAIRLAGGRGETVLQQRMWVTAALLLSSLLLSSHPTQHLEGESEGSAAGQGRWLFHRQHRKDTEAGGSCIDTTQHCASPRMRWLCRG